MSSYTVDQLANLKKAYARGVLRVREGDTQIEYQSMAAMRQAISDMEAELNTQSGGKPTGSRRVRFSDAR